MKTKDSTIIFRIPSAEKAKLQKLADKERRTISQVLQITIQKLLKKGKL